MDRKTLAAEVDALSASYHAEAEKLHAIIKEKLNEALVEAGIDKIAKLNYERGETAEIEVPIPGKSYCHAITLYFGTLYSSERKVALNVPTFGSFTSAMKPEVDLYVAAGALAKNLSKIQAKIDAVDFGPCKDAHRKWLTAAEKFEKEI